MCERELIYSNTHAHTVFTSLLDILFTSLTELLDTQNMIFICKAELREREIYCLHGYLRDYYLL